MSVQEKHRFDVASLERYLKERIEGFVGPLTVEQFQGGQSNPTYGLVDTGARSGAGAGPGAGSRGRYVLRRKPPGKLLPSAHAVDREYKVITALAKTDVPVPRTYCLCEDDSVIGTAFYVMDWVFGRILYDGTLPGFSRDERSAVYDDLNRVIAALHQVDPAAVGLADYGKPGNYFARQIERWTKQYRASETEKLEAMERLIEWLPAHIPPGDEASIVHGDYRLDNVVLHPTESRIVAVLDWELSTLGHPLADFAYHCMSWHLPPFARGLAGEDLAQLGIPGESDYVARYCQRTGRAPIAAKDWGFYLAYNLFRLAGILQGIMGRVVAGTAASKQAEAMGRAAPAIAQLGWAQVEKL